MEEFTVSMDMPMEHMQNLFGRSDAYIKRIEDDLHVMIVDRDQRGTQCSYEGIPYRT